MNPTIRYRLVYIINNCEVLMPIQTNKMAKNVKKKCLEFLCNIY